MQANTVVHIDHHRERREGTPTTRVVHHDNFVSLDVGTGPVPTTVGFLVDDNSSPAAIQSLIDGFRAFADALEQRRKELGR